jgi:hypothetical protein
MSFQQLVSGVLKGGHFRLLNFLIHLGIILGTLQRADYHFVK